MKFRLAAVFLFVGASLCATAPVLAQNSPKEVTEAQLKQYKGEAEKGCRDAGQAQGDPPEKVAAFCRCITSAFEKAMPREEWQRAYLLSKQGRSAEERNVFGPYEPKIRGCVPSQG